MGQRSWWKFFASFGVICANEETELSSEGRIKRVAEQKVETEKLRAPEGYQRRLKPDA